MNTAIFTVYSHTLPGSRPELLKDILKGGNSLHVIGVEPAAQSEPLLTAAGVTYSQADLARRNLNPFKELRSIFSVMKILKENKTESLLMYGVRIIPCVVIAARLAKVKNIVAVVNGGGNLLMTGGLRGNLLRMMIFPLLRIAFKLADSVVFQNKDDYEEFKKLHVFPKKKKAEFTNGSGISLIKYKSLPMPEESVFTLVGRMTAAKGVDEFVKAAGIVHEKFPSAVFQLVGQKDVDDDVDWTAINASAEYIKYLGESKDVVKVLTNSRFFVLPSYREGTPRSTLEALASGRPIITTDVPGCRETVIDGLNGFLVGLKDAEQLAEKMLYMLENPEKAVEMGKQSRILAEKKFNVEDVNEELIKLLGIS